MENILHDAKTIKTFSARIALGLRKGYTGELQSIVFVNDICQFYCDYVKTCITVTPTTFFYVDGKEDGCLIEFIAYPRFPKEILEIKKEAITLAKMLMFLLSQFRVSVICTDETYTLENPFFKEGDQKIL